MSTHVDLPKRVITGVIGGATLLAVVLWGGRLGVGLLGVGLSLGMLNEWIEITFTLSDKPEKRWVLLGFAWLVAFSNFWIPRAEYELFLILFVLLFSYFLFTAERHSGPALTSHFQELVYSVFGSFYLVFLPLFLVLLRDLSHGVDWTIFFFLLIWTEDTAAYFVGKKYGKRKLYERISPKKTIEGGVGGLAGGVVFSLLYKVVIFRSMPWLSVLFIPIFVGALSQVGDLCESFLKRAFNKKDSGAVLPGHGGFLDRFDSFVFSLPVMYACVRIFS